jgi:regulator of protease activity HflC (stomatin/prohibitin superfamily)
MQFLTIVILVFLLVYAVRSTRIVHPWEKGILERLGKYRRTFDSGLHFIVPFVDRLTKVDMRENVVDIPPQEVITKDNVAVTVDAVVYYEATDPVKLLYNVQDFYMAATKLAQTNLRNVIGEMQLDESLTSRERINATLARILDDATDKWGVRVVRVELQRIEPPKDVTEAMHRQMKAERDKRAKILEAEGDRQADINRAEGHKQGAILKSEGDAAAIRQIADAEKYQKLTVAEGEGAAIRTVFGAIHAGGATNDVIAIRYLEALETISNGHANKVFLPMEVTGILGSLGGIAELFKADQAPVEAPAAVPAPAHPIAPKAPAAPHPAPGPATPPPGNAGGMTPPPR